MDPPAMETPSLKTRRLLLRPSTIQDLPFILELFSRFETNRFSAYDDISSLEEAQQLFDAFLKPGSPTHFRLVADLLNTGEAIGTLGLYGYSERDRRAELGYDLLPQHWGMGYMSEAVGELMRYAFEVLRLNRVEATTDAENYASIRLGSTALRRLLTLRIMRLLGFLRRQVLCGRVCLGVDTSIRVAFMMSYSSGCSLAHLRSHSVRHL
jgi:[ribosomal protein S5]-alanine N-acetyltransferase